MATLLDYPSVRTALFLKISVEEYWIGAGYAARVIACSDHSNDFTFNSQEYTALGQLMAVSDFTQQIRTSSEAVTVTLNGIPNSSIEEIVKSRIKSSPVEIYRAFFDSNNTLITGLDIANPIRRFTGYVNNYSLTEEWDVINKQSSNTITLDIGSNVDVIQRKVAGRRTNPRSMKTYYPTDKSFDRVPALAGQALKFGRTK